LKRGALLFLVVASLLVIALVAKELLDRREARLFQATLAAADVKTCPRAIYLDELCGRCVAAFCCKEIDACHGADDCIDLNDCTVNCGEEGEEEEGVSRSDCRKACAKKHAASVATFRAWDNCSVSHCASVCPRTSRN
jgi:hypothetical protein